MSVDKLVMVCQLHAINILIIRILLLNLNNLNELVQMVDVMKNVICHFLVDIYVNISVIRMILNILESNVTNLVQDYIQNAVIHVQNVVLKIVDDANFLSEISYYLVFTYYKMQNVGSIKVKIHLIVKLLF